MIYSETLNAIPLNDYKNVWNFCTICIVLFVIFPIMSITISNVFIYFHWYLKYIIFILSSILILKQQFIQCNSIECISNEHINGKYKRNKHQKSNFLLFWWRINIENFNRELLKTLAFFTLDISQ